MNEIPFTLEELRSIQKIAEAVARNAGQVISTNFLNRLNDDQAEKLDITCKDGVVDMVTEVDRKCEEIIITELQKKFPDHDFVGEEGTFLKSKDVDVDKKDNESYLSPSKPTWIIDPLDGTSNFIKLYPFVAVSIGLVYKNFYLVGVIYNPILNEMYSAVHGGGATRNGSICKVNDTKKIQEALIVNNIGSSRSMNFIDMTLDRINYLLKENMMAFRSSGSAACNMAHVASGQVDIYYEDGYGGPWDVAAGICIINESGGVVTDISGQPFRLKNGKGKIICGNKNVVADIATKLKAADDTRMRKKWRSIVLRCLGSTILGYFLYNSKDLLLKKKSMSKWG